MVAVFVVSVMLVDVNVPVYAVELPSSSSTFDPVTFQPPPERQGVTVRIAAPADPVLHDRRLRPPGVPDDQRPRLDRGVGEGPGKRLAVDQRERIAPEDGRIRRARLSGAAAARRRVAHRCHRRHTPRGRRVRARRGRVRQRAFVDSPEDPDRTLGGAAAAGKGRSGRVHRVVSSAFRGRLSRGG